MKLNKHLYLVIVLVTFLFVFASAQTANTYLHFENKALSFDYPAGWEISEADPKQPQTIILTRKDSAARIVANLEEHDLGTCDFRAERERIAAARLATVAAEISADGQKSAASTTAQLGDAEVAGTQLQGVVNGRRVTAGVYATRLKHRFLSLAYIRAADDKLSTAAWNAVRTSLKVEPLVLAVKPVTAEISQQSITSGVLNGRALLLPKPEYSRTARSAHASGTVAVQVIIDEAGDVIAAHAVSGNPLLQPASVAAARGAKFSPTKLCGEPTRVTGLIAYNFVRR